MVPSKATLSKLIPRRGIVMRGINAGIKFDTYGGSLRYFLGGIDKEEEETLSRLLKPGQVVYDVGANIGFYAVAAARRVKPQGHVYAFEPMPSLAQVTRENVRRNGLTNVTVIESAVANQCGSIEFSVSENTSMGGIRGGQVQGVRNITVPVTTLDAFVAGDGVRPPELILLDIEGAEIDAFRGMLGVLERHRPQVVVEIHWLRDEVYALRDAELRSIGYTITTLSGGDLPAEPVRYHALLVPTAKA